jgi:hypothetical protein
MSVWVADGVKRFRSTPTFSPSSDLNLLRDRQRVVDLDAEVADRALDLRMAEGATACL